MKQKLIDLIVRLALKLVVRYRGGIIWLPVGIDLTLILEKKSVVEVKHLGRPIDIKKILIFQKNLKLFSRVHATGEQIWKVDQDPSSNPR